jgi:hypothetical protein
MPRDPFLYRIVEATRPGHARRWSMSKGCVELEYIRQRIESCERSLDVRTGIRAGDAGTYPPEPIVCYGVEPLPGVNTY